MERLVLTHASGCINLSFNPSVIRTYIAFNKPYAILCQFSKPENSSKETLAKFHFPSDVYSVGRLDYDSEGLLIISDDPRLNEHLLNPVRGHRRQYLVQVENIPDAKALESLTQGVIIEGRQTLPAGAELLTSEPDLPPRSVPIRERKNIPTSWIKLTLTEGKNRQVRKMTAAVGCPTLRLVRVAIGSLSMLDLKLVPGQWRKLTLPQVQQLFDL
jgi:23S rRNA pseudouridine2457 synthase